MRRRFARRCKQIENQNQIVTSQKMESKKKSIVIKKIKARVQAIETEAKACLVSSSSSSSSVPKVVFWPHLTYAENVVASAFRLEVLEHPRIWWLGFDDRSYERQFIVATGAKHGCLVCKAALIQELDEFWLMGESDGGVAGRMMTRFVDELKTELAKPNDQPFLSLVAVAQASNKRPGIMNRALMTYPQISNEALIVGWIKQAIEAKDYRIFRLGPLFPLEFEQAVGFLGEYPDSPDWLYWRAMLTMDKQLGKNKSPPYGWSKTQYYAQFVVAADAGSVEAMRHLVSHGSDKTKLYAKQLIERYPYVSRSMLHELDPYEEDLVKQKEPPSGYEEILEYIEERRPFFAWHFDEHRVVLKDDVPQKRAAPEDEVSLVRVETKFSCSYRHDFDASRREKLFRISEEWAKEKLAEIWTSMKELFEMTQLEQRRERAKKNQKWRDWTDRRDGFPFPLPKEQTTKKAKPEVAEEEAHPDDDELDDEFLIQCITGEFK